MIFLAPSNDTRVNLLLLLSDFRTADQGARETKGSQAEATQESPLFVWETLARRLGTQQDQAALKGEVAGTENGSASCPPASDPFTVSVQADQALKPEERDALLAARKTTSGCPAGPGAITPAEIAIKTSTGKAYAAYLEGASAFRRGDYDKAATTFPGLANAPSAWVKETATYMIGRTLINRAQVGAFDEFGSFKEGWHAAATVIEKAETALDVYLHLYPNGTYAKSARGLKRRGYWLAHDNEKLYAEYGSVLQMSPADRNISDIELVQEIDNKLAGSPYSDGDLQKSLSANGPLQNLQNPLLLAMVDLAEMRTLATSESTHSETIPLQTLQAQKPRFMGQMALYQYLLAVHAFYIDKSPAEVLQLIPDAARQDSFSYLQFSRQMLRGMALEATKDPNALGFWQQMLQGAKAPHERGALELAIAFHEERANAVRNVFAPASPVRYPYLREVLLVNIADADLLRTQAKDGNAPQRERQIALFTLLYKESTRGYAADFLKDLVLVPTNAPTDGPLMLDGDRADYYLSENYAPIEVPLGIFLHDKTDTHFGCPSLRATETRLAGEANNPTARLCLADFVRLNQAAIYAFNTTPSAEDLGGTASLFPGKNFVRLDAYTGVLANPKASRNDKAYALFRAVNCYAPSGNNDCGGKDVPKAQRKAWFLALKHDYAGTPWADQLEYFW